MKKRVFLLLLLFFVLPALAFAGGSKDKSLSVTDAERAQGWRFFEPIGFRLLRPQFFNDYDESIWSDQLGDAYDEENPIFGAYYYEFAPTEALDLDNELVSLYYAQKLSYEDYYVRYYNEVDPLVKPLYGLFALRTKAVGKTDLSEITGYTNNQVIRKTSNYISVFAYDDFDFSGLNPQDKAIYTEMSKQIPAVKSTIKCQDPFLTEWHLLDIKNLKFDTIDLNGKRVTSDIFKNYDVTMINIWATWCGPCKRELPDLAKVYELYKTKNCNIIGITTDVTPDDQEALDTAISIIKQSGVKYTVLQANEDFDKPILNYVNAIPTTIFVDKNGTIIAPNGGEDLIIGSLDYEYFCELFEQALRAVGK